MTSEDDETSYISLDNFCGGNIPSNLTSKIQLLKKTFSNIYTSRKSLKKFQEKKTKLTYKIRHLCIQI